MERVFRLFDFHIFNDKGSESSDDECGYNKDKTSFMIQMFGINEVGNTCSIMVEEYKPFFNDYNKKLNIYTVKTSLKSILIDYDNNFNIINQLVLDSNEYVIQTYQFMRLYFLYCFQLLYPTTYSRQLQPNTHKMKMDVPAKTQPFQLEKKFHCSR